MYTPEPAPYTRKVPPVGPPGRSGQGDHKEEGRKCLPTAGGECLPWCPDHRAGVEVSATSASVLAGEMLPATSQCPGKTGQPHSQSLRQQRVRPPSICKDLEGSEQQKGELGLAKSLERLVREWEYVAHRSVCTSSTASPVVLFYWLDPSRPGLTASCSKKTAGK